MTIFIGTAYYVRGHVQPWWRLVAGTRPATTLTPVAYASMDFIGRTFSFPYCFEILDFLY